MYMREQSVRNLEDSFRDPSNKWDYVVRETRVVLWELMYKALNFVYHFIARYIKFFLGAC